MRLLAIDTAFEACSVGVSAGDDRSPVLRSEAMKQGQAERLLDMIREAMAAAGLEIPELVRIAVTVGPGSFTGVRIGIAAARGLRLVTGCPIVGIGTLTVHAETARSLAGRKPVLVALDARRGEVYAQLFDADGTALTEPEVGPPEYFAARVTAATMLAGSGAPLIAARLGGDAEARIVHRQSVPDIAALIKLGLTAEEQSAPPRPLYLRPPDAKPQVAAAVARR